MNNALIAWPTLCLATVCSGVSANAPTSTTADSGQYLRAPQPAVILARDTNNRVLRFRDETGREQQCSYDQSSRLIRIAATDDHGATRQTLLAYDEQDRLVVARFPSGYTIFFEYPANGARLAHDYHGNHITLGQSAPGRADSRDPEGLLVRASTSALAVVDALK